MFFAQKVRLGERVDIPQAMEDHRVSVDDATGLPFLSLYVVRHRYKTWLRQRAKGTLSRNKRTLTRFKSITKVR